MTTTTERRDFGTIYHQKRSPFLWVRYRVDGKEYRESTESTNPKVAEKLLARRQAELGLGAFTAPNVKRTSFEDVVAMLTDDYVVNGRKSLRTLKTLLKRLRITFGGARVATITADRLTAYVRERLTDGAAGSTVRNEMNALRRALRLAHRAGTVASVPAFPTVNPGPPRAGFLEDADLPRLLGELSADLRPLAHFLALTGWRVGEAVALTWGAVDFRTGVVTLAVGSTKNGAGRHFPFGALPELVDLLTAQREATTAIERRTGQIVARVFHRAGAPIKNFHDAWKGATTRAGLPGLLVHDLRRSAIRRFVRAGIPERVAMTLSGHKSRSVFDRYNIVSERDLSENVAKLAISTAGAAKSLPFKRATGGTK
jgi:integrase